MKKFKFLLGALGIITLGLTSCSENAVGPQEPEKVDKDQSRFVTIAISAPSSGIASRAFTDGTTKESLVKRLDFLFYDVNGNPTATPKTIQSFEGNSFKEGPFESGNVTRIYTSVVPVELTQGQNLPAQVVCIVNSNQDVITSLTNKTLSELIDIQQSNFTREGNFLMTNSVYYGQDILTGQPNQRLCATPINANSQLFKTEADAQEAIESDASGALVNIYVERVAAKVALSLAKADIKPYTMQNGDGEGTVSLTFVPEFWAMNATDNNLYLTKRYGVSSTNMTPSYDEINNALTTAGFTTWNDDTNHRSYWGTSPSYFNNAYPLTSDQVNNLEAGTQEEEGTYLTKYYSYNEIKAQASGTTAVNNQAVAAVGGNFENAVIYTRETTTPDATINDESGNPAATVASAVVVGHYVVGDATEGSDFYVDRNVGEGGTYYGSMENARAALIARQSILFADANGQQLYANTERLTVAHPTYAVRKLLANPNIAGRLVALQLTAVPTSAYYFNATTGTYQQVNGTNLNLVNAQLVSAGYMEYFDKGLAFFSVPIRHLNWKEISYTAGPTVHGVTAAGTYNWTSMKVGELGVVRNHTYSLTISSISGLGNALRSPDQPIVPAKDAVKQYIAMRLNILAWNVVSAWSVPL